MPLSGVHYLGNACSERWGRAGIWNLSKEGYKRAHKKFKTTLKNKSGQFAIFDDTAAEDKTITLTAIKRSSNKAARGFYFNENSGTSQLNKVIAIHRCCPYIHRDSEDLILSIIKEFADPSTTKLQ